jgi:uncharacterized membrane protein YbhN (UPF0104 family)
VKPWIRLLGWTVLAASAGYLAFALRQALRTADLSPPRWDLFALGSLAAAAGVYVATVVLGGWAWSLLLRSAGEAAEPGGARKVVTIHLICQAAKYLPGNVGHYAGRMGLAARRGLSLPVVASTMAVEAAWSVVSAAVLAGAALLGAGGPLLAAAAPRLAAGGRIWIALALSAGVALVGIRLLGTPWFARVAGLPPDRPWRRPGAAVLAACGAIQAMAFLLYGVIATLLGPRLLGLADLPLLPLAGLFAAAWLAGFLTPGAPAGLGVREAVLVAGLGPLYGPGPALALAAWFRLVTVAGDGLSLLLGLALDRHQPTGCNPDS